MAQVALRHQKPTAGIADGSAVTPTSHYLPSRAPPGLPTPPACHQAAGMRARAHAAPPPQHSRPLPRTTPSHHGQPGLQRPLGAQLAVAHLLAPLQRLLQPRHLCGGQRQAAGSSGWSFPAWGRAQPCQPTERESTWHAGAGMLLLPSCLVHHPAVQHLTMAAPSSGSRCARWLNRARNSPQASWPPMPKSSKMPWTVEPRLLPVMASNSTSSSRGHSSPCAPVMLLATCAAPHHTRIPWPQHPEHQSTHQAVAHSVNASLPVRRLVGRLSPRQPAQEPTRPSTARTHLVGRCCRDAGRLAGRHRLLQRQRLGGGDGRVQLLELLPAGRCHLGHRLGGLGQAAKVPARARGRGGAGWQEPVEEDLVVQGCAPGAELVLPGQCRALARCSDAGWQLTARKTAAGRPAAS